MKKDVWMVVQKDHDGNYINLHTVIFTKEQDAIDETKFQNLHESDEYEWDYEIFFLKD